MIYNENTSSVWWKRQQFLFFKHWFVFCSTEVSVEKKAKKSLKPKWIDSIVSMLEEAWVIAFEKETEKQPCVCIAILNSFESYGR